MAMSIRGSVTRGLLCTVTLAVLVGCGGSRSQVASLSLPAPGAGSGSGNESWMDRDAIKKRPLLYVADYSAGDVDVYSYPKGKLTGMLTGFAAPAGDCVDRKGDVWITESSGAKIDEYMHGSSTPSMTLSDPNERPFGCSVDPVNGNLAVTNVTSTGSTHGSVVIYEKVTSGFILEGPYYVPDPYFDADYCSYDNAGNLFVDGSSAGYFKFYELPNGSTTFREITLNQTFGFPGGVQWNGTNIAVGDDVNPVIYQFTISGSSGTEVGSTPLTGASGVGQFFIKRGHVIAPDAGRGDVGIYHYPTGGSPIKVLGGLTSPLAAVISK